MRQTLLDLIGLNPLNPLITFGGGGGGGGGGDSGGSDDKPAKKTVGSVSKTGQYAGDGFEWVDSGSGYLTRTYTGANKDAGLGQDVRTGGTEDKAVKEAIASISLNEGSEFAGSQASATDYDALDIFRSQDNQTASSSFAEQAGVSNYEPSIVYGDDDDTPVAQAAEEESFGDAFARNRAAGADTFTYKGNLYTTDLAPEPAAPAPTPGYATMGVGEAGRGGEAEMRVVDQVDTSQPLPDEEDLFEQPVVSESAQDYLDTLGTDFDFTQFDDDTADTGIDYTVSQGEAGRGGDDTAAPGFTYTPNIIDTSAKDADLGVGATTVGVTADDLAAGTGAVTFPTTAGGSVTFTTDRDANTRLINSMVDAAVAAGDAGADLDASEKAGADALLGVDLVSSPTTPALGVGSDMTPQLATELGVNFFEGDTLTSDDIKTLAGKGFDVDMSGVVDTLTGLAQVNFPAEAAPFSGNIYGTDSPYREALQQQIIQNAITPAVTDAEGRRRRADRVTTPGTSDSTTGRLLATGIGTGAKVAGSFMEALGETLSPTTARIGFDVGEVDRRLAEAAGASPGATAMKTGAEKSGVAQFGRDLAETGARMEDRIEGGLPQATQEALVAPIVGTEISALGRPGLTLDVDALKAQTLKSIPATLAGLSGFALGPVGAGITGAAMTGGEVGYESGAEVKNEALRRGFSEDEADAMQTEALKTGALLGAPAGAISNLLFGRVIPGQGRSVIGQTAKNIAEESFSEGYVEQNIAGLASDPLLNRQTAGTRFSPNEAIIGGLIGGAVTPVLSATQAPKAPAVDTQTYTPPAATTGQVAQVPPGVQTAYEEAAGIGGPGSDAFPDKMTAAEAIMTQQLEDTGAIDVADLQDMGLTLFEVNEAAERAISSKMDSDNQMLQALADQSVLDTGGISQELVEEINDKLGPEAGAQVVDNAVNRPFVSNEGKTRMDIMLENAAKAGEESVASKPATGIETALGTTATETQTDVPTDETTDVPTDETTDVVEDVTTDVTTNIPVDTVVGDDDDEVEVEVDDTTTTDTGDDVTVDVDVDDTFVPVVTTTDDDGNTITECPEGYVMVETPDGPMCQKSVEQVRQRAGRGVQAYTGIVTRPGERGPGQRRITTTRTQRVRPTTRSA